MRLPNWCRKILDITLDKALRRSRSEKAYDTDREVKELIDIARRLEGSVRNTGIHAAGLIISGDPLTDQDSRLLGQG